VTTPWPPGASTGIGSLPGTDPLQAATFVLEQAPDLPHLPELPARGVGADAVGRAAALLVDLPVETVAGGWAVASRPGADHRRAVELLAADVAALEVAAHGWTGPLKVQVLGPLTLAASLGRALGEAALADRALRRDLCDSLAEGLREHLGQVQARLPGAALVLQVDEPLLPAVVAGSLTTRSGWGLLGPIEQPEAIALLASVLTAVDDPYRRWVHCCAADVPVGLLVAAGAGGLSVDLGRLGPDLEPWGEAVDAGITLALGAVPTRGAPDGQAAGRRVLDLWTRLGFAAEVRRDRTVVTPACGLAGAGDVSAARAAYEAAREAAAVVAEEE
jgi:hypothetical protein